MAIKLETDNRIIRPMFYVGGYVLVSCRTSIHSEEGGYHFYFQEIES